MSGFARIRSAATLDPSETFAADICIVGAGIAGITTALALADARRSVCLIEAGGWKQDPVVQSDYGGDPEAPERHPPPDRYRRRQFGGTSTIWGGQCVPLDPVDFQPRQDLETSGWPVPYAEIARWYAPACGCLEAGDATFGAREAGLSPRVELIPGLSADARLIETLERFSAPTDFGRTYRAQLAAQPNLLVLLDAPVVGLVTSDDQTNVHAVTIATPDGGRRTIRCGRLVLAMGALETTRFLLHLDRGGLLPLGPAAAHLGRYYMCHLAGDVDGFRFRVGIHHGYERDAAGVYCRRRIQLRADEQRRLRIGNLAARVHFPNPSDPRHGSGVLSLAYLGRRFLSYEYSRRLQRERPGSLAPHLWNIARDAVGTGRFVARWMRHNRLSRRKLPSVVVQTPSGDYSLDLHVEQVPNASSRVVLGRAVDRFGMPRLSVQWKHSEHDERTITASLATIADALRTTGTGAATFDPDRALASVLDYGAYGGHHIGTARMSRSPRDGVVDTDCRVHGTSNLYVAGSAVFPTSGQAPPTLTIVALALRLAAHLRELPEFPHPFR